MKESSEVTQAVVAPLAATEIHTAEFSVFYRRFTARLVAFLIFQGCATTEAADIAQETMFDAWRSWPSIRTPEAWARRVASRKLAARFASVEEPADLSGSPLLPSQVDTSDFEERHIVIRLLRLLPPRERQVLAWTVDGYSAAEIAEELGLKPGAVSTYLRQARLRLAQHRGEV